MNRPIELAYDELPPGSDLSRHLRDGGVKIVSPAGELRDAIKRRLWRQTVVPASIVSALYVALAMLIALALLGRMSAPFPLGRWAMAAFLVFCAGVFLLVWQSIFLSMTETVGRARRQATIIDADRSRLRVETTGPLGDASHELSASTIAAIHVRKLKLLARRGQRVACLLIETTDKGTLRLLQGRDEAELNWVARNLRRVLSHSE